MNVYQILNSLEKSWERDDILLKLKNGLDADKIVNEFISNKKKSSRHIEIKHNYYLLKLIHSVYNNIKSRKDLHKILYI